MNLQAKEPSGTSIVAAQRPFPTLSRGVLPAFQPWNSPMCTPADDTDATSDMSTCTLKSYKHEPSSTVASGSSCWPCRVDASSSFNGASAADPTKTCWMSERWTLPCGSVTLDVVVDKLVLNSRDGGVVQIRNPVGQDEKIDVAVAGHVPLWRNVRHVHVQGNPIADPRPIPA